MCWLVGWLLPVSVYGGRVADLTGAFIASRRVQGVLDQMKALDPQYDLNGLRNVWIVKPAGLSRGRGTCVVRRGVEEGVVCGVCVRGGHYNIPNSL